MPHRRGLEEAGTDDTEGHMPRIKPDAAVQPAHDNDDTEGHATRGKGIEDADTEGEDTEGHVYKSGRVQPVGDDEEDTEGHRRHLRS